MIKEIRVNIILKKNRDMEEKLTSALKGMIKLIVLELRNEENFNRNSESIVKVEELKKFIGLKEASKIYGVHYNTLRNWVQNDQIESKRIGVKIYVANNL